MAASSSGFLTSIIINIVTFIIAFFVFSLLRVAPFFKKFYASRWYNPNNKRKPTSLPSTLYGWLMPIISYKEPSIITEAGLDTAMYLRVTAFGIELFFWLSLWCLIVMLPVNLTDNYIDTLMATSTSLNSNCTSNQTNQTNITCANSTSTDNSVFTFTEFDKVSLANITPGSDRFWVHCISVYVVTAITLYLLYRYSKESVILRIMYLANSAKGRSSHTILVTDIPAISAETSKQLKDIKNSRKSNKNLKDAEMEEVTEDAAKAEEIPAIGQVVGGAVDPIRYDYNLCDKDQIAILSPGTEATKVLATGVSPQRMIEAEFDKIYPNAVSSVQLVTDLSNLTPLVNEYMSLTQKLDDLVDGCEFKLSQGKEVKRPKTLIFPLLSDAWTKEKYGSGLYKSVDAFDYFAARLKWLERVIPEEQKLAARTAWPTAFVIFQTRKDKEIAATSLMHHDPNAWKTQAAPEPSEIIWTNLWMPSGIRSALGALGWAGFITLTLFFMIPVAAIQGLIEVSRVSSVPGLGWLGNPVISRLLQGIIPGLALKIFLILVPPIIRLFIKTAGAVSENELDMGTVSRYFLFQVVVVFFGTVIAGSFFNQITVWIQDPLSVISILGTAIPAVSTFYINYLAVLAMTVKPIAFTKIVGVIIYWILKKISSNPKAADRLWMNQTALLGTAVVDHSIVALLGLVYSSINPIITPFALVYFCINFLIDRYNCLYMTKFPYDSFGKLWPKVFGHVMCALYILQITMLGLLGIKKFKATPVLVPVPIITLIYHLVVVNMFSRPWEFISLHDAANCDIADRSPLLSQGDQDEEAAGLIADKDAYLSPLMKVKKGDANELLSLATAVLAKIEGGVAANGTGAAAANAPPAAASSSAPANEALSSEMVEVDEKDKKEAV